MSCKYFSRLAGAYLALLFAVMGSASAAGPSQQKLDAAAQKKQFAFVLFYRESDAQTERMYQTLQTALGDRKDAIALPVQITNDQDRDLVEQFDATRIPMPAVVALAPNGAICSAFPTRVSAKQIEASFVTPTQAECLKALQDNQIVLLCVQGSAEKSVPAAVNTFRNDPMYKDRTKVLTVDPAAPAEAPFLRQLRVPADHTKTFVALLAPPGAALGVFDEAVSFDQLAQKLAADGMCCEDENCKYNKAAAKSGAKRR